MLARTAFLTIALMAAAPHGAEAKQPKKNAQCAAVNGIEKCKLSSTGHIRLHNTSCPEDASKIPLVFNQQNIAGELLLYHTHVYDDDHYKDMVKGEFVIDNFSANKEYIQYQVILKDKKGHVAKTTGDIIVPLGKKQRIRLSSVPLSKKEIHNISSYEIKCVASNIKLHR